VGKAMSATLDAQRKLGSGEYESKLGSGEQEKAPFGAFSST
jgi:hypothetical protein